MQPNEITSRKLFEQTMKRVAPLPCQEDYAWNLAKILSIHIHRNQLIDEGWLPDELPSMSAIVVAPTGQGKTYLVRKMAEVLGLNLITIDCSTLVPEGYKGVSLSQRLSNAMATVKDKETFCRSILFFDEIDKLCSSQGFPSNRMSNILQLFNNGTVEVEDGKNSSLSIDISRCAILFGGAFVGLDDIIRQRVCPPKAAKIGFSFETAENTNTEPSVGELLQQATLEDMEKYGLMPELLGRIGTVLSIQPLELEDYRQLLTAEAGSLTAKYRAYLKALYGVGFEISEAGVEKIAAKCMEASTGARAATPLVNDIMRSAISAVEDENAICKVILSVDGDDFCLLYEHGSRDPVFFANNGDARRNAANEAEAKLPVHTIRPNNREACVRTLLRYYRNAGGTLDDIPALQPFLALTVRFLHEKCNPRDFMLLNMIKLAEAIQKNRKTQKSPYSIIMRDYHFTFLPEYDMLSKAYDIWTARELVKALGIIRDYLYEKHGPCRVLFAIRSKKSSKTP